MKLGKLFRAAVDIATIPLSLGADAITLGNYGDQTYTSRKLEKIEDELDEATE